MSFLAQFFQPVNHIPPGDIADYDFSREINLQSGGKSNSGKSVTPNTAMRTSAVFACVNVISQTVAQLPLNLYRRTATGKELAKKHPLFTMLGAKPNKFHNSFNFREMMTAHMCLRGNSFAFINRIGNGKIYELLPLNPDCVGVYRDPWTWEVTYSISQKQGINGIYGQNEVLHIMGMTLDGFRGVSPITYAREAVGLALATEEHGARLFSNGAKMGGILSHPGRFKDPSTAQKIGKSFDAATSGANVHSTIVLEEGMKWEKMGMTSEDSQFLETRQYQVPEIARFYRMPLHKIQDLTKSTNNNIEQQALEFLTDCMMPWFVRFEQALNSQLLTTQEQSEYFFKFDVDDILRADMKSRFEAYSSAITSRIMNPNECREKEDMNPYPDGEKYENPNTISGKGAAPNENLV